MNKLFRAKINLLVYGVIMGLMCGSHGCKAKVQQLVPEIGATYEHYSGKRYTIVAIANHSENLEKYVVYQGQYNDPEFGNNPVWVRPLTMFMETVEKNGKIIQRFKKI
jgi:hypothetical protein